MGGKILQKWGLQPPPNPCNYLRERVCTKSYFKKDLLILKRKLQIFLQNFKNDDKTQIV